MEIPVCADCRPGVSDTDVLAELGLCSSGYRNIRYFLFACSISLVWPLGRRIDITKAIASGLLCGCAILFKPQFGIEAIVLLAL